MPGRDGLQNGRQLWGKGNPLSLSCTGVHLPTLLTLSSTQTLDIPSPFPTGQGGEKDLDFATYPSLKKMADHYTECEHNG